MVRLDGDCNLLTKFSNISAEAYAEAIEEKNSKIAKDKATKIIKYIEKRYEAKVKKALERDVKCHLVDISLPYFWDVKDKNIYKVVNTFVSEHFKPLGFHVELHQGKKCGCIFDCICNGNRFYAEMSW